jgi:hypothetical protein
VIHVGVRLYRVVVDIKPGGGDAEDGWMVQSRAVITATKKTFVLDRPFSFCPQSHGAVGRIMFVSEAVAIRDFADKASWGSDLARRQLAETERMVEWAERTAKRPLFRLFDAPGVDRSRHCDDFIDDESAPQALRTFLARARSPAHGMTSVDPFPVLFADHNGQRVRVVMASRLGDVGICDSTRFTYEKRVSVEELSNFGDFP